jgi:type I restriction enzyme S subunit
MFQDLKPYPAYDASHSWEGQVPAHWRLASMRALAREVAVSGVPDEQMLSVSIKHGVTPQSVVLAQSGKRDSSNVDRSSYKLVEPGDVAYNKMRAWQGAAGLSAFRGIVSPAYVVLRPDLSTCDPVYLHHLLRLPGYAAEAARWSYGISSDQWSLRPEHFRLIPVAIPPIKEQRAIVTYIVHAYQRISEAIAAKRRLIALLDEYGSVITQEILAGREGGEATDLVESGSAQLGRVPRTWELATVGAIVDDIRTGPFGSQLHASEYVAGGVPVVNPKHIVGGRIVPENAVSVTQERAETLSRHRLRAGDVIAARRGELGRSAVVRQEDAGAVCGTGSMVIRVDETRISPEYFQRMFASRQTRGQLEEASRGSTMPNLNEGMVARVRVAVPPRERQDAVLKAVETDLALQAARAAVVRREIELLEDFKARLTSDVITGRVDVRAISASLPPVDLAEAFESDGALEQDDDISDSDGTEDE